MRLRRFLAGVLGVLVLSGCANTTTSVQPTASTSSVRTVQVSEVFQTGSGAALTYIENLVPAGAHGAVQARSGDGTTTVMLAVRGIEPLRLYGAHVHAEPCGPRSEDAGPHYQHAADPVQPSIDPTYANPQNEIWLDFTTDETGAGSTETTVAWQFPSDWRAGSVVIHTMATSSESGKAGTAGARAACITIEF